MFQQNGAPAHWSVDVRDLMNKTFSWESIGHDGPIARLPHSPDIIPL